jgi:phosphatidylethanolamine/phosphatidyl-N-methylethanolamine N-methyltransferase
MSTNPCHIPNNASAMNAKVAAFYDAVGFLYPVVNIFLQYRRKKMIAIVNAHNPEKMLEIGVGPGSHLSDYTCGKITAVDVSPKMMERCCNRHPQVNCLLMDGENLAFADGSFDLVALPHVLSVTCNPSRMIEEAHRVLRPEGKLVILNYDAHHPLLRKIAKLWHWPAAWLGCRSDFHLAAVDALASFSPIERHASGWLQQFSLTLWKK